MFEYETLETPGLRTVFTSPGVNIQSHRMRLPDGSEIPLMMENKQPPDQWYTNWHMLFPGRLFDGKRFGVVQHAGADHWVGEADNTADQLNGIHGSLCAQPHQIDRSVSQQLTCSFDGLEGSADWKKFPWHQLQSSMQFRHASQSLIGDERFKYCGAGTMPFNRGCHYFFPWQLDGIGKQQTDLPILTMQADAMYRKRDAGVGEEILLPVGETETITPDRDFSSGKQVPLGMDDAFRRTAGQAIGLKWIGTKYAVEVVISLSSEYEWVVLYSPQGGQFGRHFALEWQTAASNAFHLNNIGVQNIGYRELKTDQMIGLQWMVTARCWKIGG